MCLRDLVKAGSVKFVAGAQRFIIDARASNQHFSNPFGDFCLQEKVFSMLFQESLEDARNWFGGFRRCQERVSQDAHSQMAASALALPAVLAFEVGYTGKVVDKQRLVPDSLIYPVLAAFPTCFSWAMFFCQNVTDHCMLAGSALSSFCLPGPLRRAPLLGGGLLGDGHGLGSLCVRWSCADKFGVLALSRVSSHGYRELVLMFTTCPVLAVV